MRKIKIRLFCHRWLEGICDRTEREPVQMGDARYCQLRLNSRLRGSALFYLAGEQQ